MSLPPRLRSLLLLVHLAAAVCLSLPQALGATGARADGAGRMPPRSEVGLLAVFQEDPKVAEELKEADELMAEATGKPHSELQIPAESSFLAVDRGKRRHHEIPVEVSYPGSKPELEVIHVNKVPCHGDPDCGVAVASPDQIEAPTEGLGLGSSPYGDEVEAAEDAAGIKLPPRSEDNGFQDMGEAPITDLNPDQPAPALD